MHGEIKNAIIESVRIGSDRGFELTSWVMLDYGGSGQGFGGYVLGGLDQRSDACPATHHEAQPNLMAEWIAGVLRCAGVDSWDKVPGRCVRVDADHDGVRGIGHITKDIWFHPKERFTSLKQRQGASHAH